MTSEPPRSETPRKESWIAATARAWWQDLQRTDQDGNRNRNADPAALARLRRAAEPVMAMGEEATLALFRRLRLDCDSFNRLPRVAVIAMVLAHVRKDVQEHRSAIQAVGRARPDDAESAIMSPLRFRRLLACRDDDDLAREMRRFVALAGGVVNVGDLAESLYFWNDRTRARWAFHYYASAFAAPETDQTGTGQTGSAA